MSDMTLREKIGVEARRYTILGPDELEDDAASWRVVSVDDEGVSETASTHANWVDAQLAADNLNADRILSLILAEHAIVPRVPTPEMLKVGIEVQRTAFGSWMAKPEALAHYAALLSAAPQVAKQADR